MRVSFPVHFVGVLLGKSREAGEFTAEDKVVQYPDAYDLSFDNSEGLVQTVKVSLKHLDEAADFDVAALPRLTALEVDGDVHVNGDRVSFRPSKVRKAKAGAAA